MASWALAFLLSACNGAGEPDREDTAGPDTLPGVTAEQIAVLPGLEVILRDSMHLLEGHRVGFITNQTAVTSDGRSGIDLLHDAAGVNLVALYGPEHGLRGDVEGGVRIDTQRDAATGIPIFSLYGSTQRPTPEMLAGVDILLFDMQDIGARPYTFVWTMAMAMEAAAEQGIPFVVLDRPNPITGRAAGPLMEMEMRNVGQAITGYYPVLLRHGMTVGEIARYVNTEFGVDADLHVIPADGWRRSMWFDETALPWVNPSPNIRSLEAALNYAGLVLFEATNLTVGRGTDRPFSYVGAPWLRAEQVLARAASYELPGVALATTELVPDGEGWVPFRGERVQAIELKITDRDAYRPVWTALVLLSVIRAEHPDEFRITNDGFTQMMGSRWARKAFDAGEDPRTIWNRWQEELAAWEPVRARYLLYPE
ncbi:MAG TPA: DUF1343 domain-containing protein [Longimicrobiaceae bacterium]